MFMNINSIPDPEFWPFPDKEFINKTVWQRNEKYWHSTSVVGRILKLSKMSHTSISMPSPLSWLYRRMTWMAWSNPYQSRFFWSFYSSRRGMGCNSLVTKKTPIEAEPGEWREGNEYWSPNISHVERAFVSSAVSMSLFQNVRSLRTIDEWRQSFKWRWWQQQQQRNPAPTAVLDIAEHDAWNCNRKRTSVHNPAV